MIKSHLHFSEKQKKKENNLQKQKKKNYLPRVYQEG